MAKEPQKGTLDFTVREVAEKEGWTETTARNVLKDGFANGRDETEKHRRRNAEAIQELRERGEA